jgi:type I restriction enzyme S subunit
MKRTLPVGWRWVKIGEITEVSTGGTPDTNHPEYYENGNIRWLKSGDIKGTYIEEVPHRISRLGLNSSNAKTHPVGSVMLAMSGQGKTRGTSAILKVPSTCSQSVAAILPSEHAIPEIIHFALVNRYGETRRITGDNERTGLNLKLIREIEIPLPPLDEQKRIVARLDEQMRHIEQARQAAEESLSAAWELPSAYLKEMFEGEKTKKWNIVRLGEISTLIQNGIYKSADFYGHGHLFLRMYNLSNLSWNLVLEKMTQVEITDQEYSKYKLNKGDLLISRVNSFELVGKCSLVDERVENYVFENMLIRVQLSSGVHPMFIAQQMQTRDIRRQIESVAKRAIGQSSINSNDIKDLRLSLPSLSTQIEIAKKIDEKFLANEELVTSLEPQLVEINELPSALLRQAFAGQL